jgi:hypothetical protein
LYNGKNVLTDNSSRMVSSINFDGSVGNPGSVRKREREEKEREREREERERGRGRGREERE